MAIDEIPGFENGIPYPVFFGKEKSYVSLLSDPHEYIAILVRYWITFIQNFYLWTASEPYRTYLKFAGNGLFGRIHFGWYLWYYGWAE